MPRIYFRMESTKLPACDIRGTSLRGAQPHVLGIIPLLELDLNHRHRLLFVEKLRREVTVIHLPSDS